MAETVPPLPFKSKLMDSNGFVSSPWSDWFKQLFLRVGGNISPSNSELDDSLGGLPEHIANSQMHKKISNTVYTRDVDNYITRIDWANGDYEIFHRDGDGIITSITGNVYSRTFTRNGSGYITATGWSLS